MFERYGEFESVDEINKAAQGFRDEGDMDSIRGLAKENGIDPMDAEDFINGDTDRLATLTTASQGRLNVEEAASKKDKSMTQVIFNMARTMAAGDKEDAVMFLEKGKRLDGIIDEMCKEASKNKTDGVGCVCGTDVDLMRRIRNYYGRATA